MLDPRLAMPNHRPAHSLGLLALVSLAACGNETEIRLHADRETISAGGIEAATITAQAFLSGDPVKAGTSIAVETTNGSFESGSSLTSQSKSTDGAGQAIVKLFSAPAQGSATVTASFSDETSGLSATSSISIGFGPPSGAGMPVDGTFRMTCDAVNIAALREPLPDIQVTCNLSALTRGGQAIKASALTPTFMTEAGTLSLKTDSSSGESVVLYSPKGGASAPKDVPPESSLAEPSYADKNGRQRNPRDGLATLVAVIDGEEAFTDSNGNGKYDQGEPFVDAAEPFVDMNDNDKWDPDEKYLDVNGNGRWDEANGKWDAQTKIMAVYKILWTGPLDDSSKTSRIEHPTTQIPQGGKLELTAYALDANMNPVAAFQKNSDYLEWKLVSGGDATSEDDLNPPMDNALGFSFDKAATTERKRWMILSKSFTAAPYRFTVSDGDASDSNPATSFSVTATVHVTPGPGADGSYLQQLTKTLADKVEGTCE